MEIKFKKVRQDASVPRYATPAAAGADLCACLGAAVTIAPGETAMVPTGLSLEIPEGFAGIVCARSGLATKRGLAPANKVGVIDSDYRGELMVSLYNHGPSAQTVTPGERVAQLLIMPVASCAFVETAELGATERGSGGFGSTGRV